MPSHNEHAMTTTSCYHASCKSQTKWSVASQAATPNPDGSPLTLSTCDTHYTTLTGDLRRAGTKYTLSPINGPHITSPIPAPPQTEEDVFRESVKGRHPFIKALMYSVVGVVMVVVTPFTLTYYGVKWLIGWRPWRKS